MLCMYVQYQTDMCISCKWYNASLGHDYVDVHCRISAWMQLYMNIGLLDPK